jgi:hypothetical protein
MQVRILQEHGVPLFTTSVQSFAKQLEDSLTKLEQDMGSAPVAIIERSIGRSTYHLAIFAGSSESASESAPASKRASKSKAKSEPEPVDESLGDVVAE